MSTQCCKLVELGDVDAISTSCVGQNLEILPDHLRLKVPETTVIDVTVVDFSSDLFEHHVHSVASL